MPDRIRSFQVPEKTFSFIHLDHFHSFRSLALLWIIRRSLETSLSTQFLSFDMWKLRFFIPLLRNYKPRLSHIKQHKSVAFHKPCPVEGPCSAFAGGCRSLSAKVKQSPSPTHRRPFPKPTKQTVVTWYVLSREGKIYFSLNSLVRC
jgi:hypothetical protein